MTPEQQAIEAQRAADARQAEVDQATADARAAATNAAR